MTQPWKLDAPDRRRTWTPQLVTQLVVVLAVLAAGVTGAGLLRGREDGGDVLRIVQAASASAARQPTLRATFTFRVSGSGVDVTSTGDVLVDTVRRISSGTVTAPGVGALDTVSSGGVSYARLPGGRADAAGHHWVALRLLRPGVLPPVGGQDPLSALKLVSDPKKVEVLGGERINGVSTQHYRVQLEPNRLAGALATSGLSISIPPGALDALKSARIELWVDAKNLPRRMTMTFAMSSLKASLAFDYLDYGKAFEVTLPPVTDVTEVTSVQQLGAALVGH